MSVPRNSNLDHDLNFGETVRGINSEIILFERFKTKRVLGRGGIGVVWLAEDQKLGREVALKLLPDMIALDAASLSDLRKETRNGLILSHPTLVRMLDLVEEGPSAAIVMEYVNGKTLSDLRVLQPNLVFEVSTLRAWVEQMLEALSYAHTQVKLVHRDLKPQNVMINTNDQLKVADFGIASCMRDSLSRVSAKANSAGTLVYMSPQQLMGESPRFADDIYSFGATLYELLTGKPPFYAGDIPKQIETKIAPKVAERRREFGIEGDPIAPEWEEVIAACLEKHPQNRPESMAEVKLGLNGKSFKRGSGDTRIKSALSSAAHSGMPAWLPAAAVLVIGLGAAWYWGVHQPKRESQAQERLEIIKREEKLALRQKNLGDELQRFHERAQRLPAEVVTKGTPSKLAAWNEFKAKLLEFDYPADFPETRKHRELLALVDGQVSSLNEKLKKKTDDYSRTIDQLRKDYQELQKECEKPDLGASPKHKLVEQFLEKWPTRELSKDYGLDHETLHAECSALAAKWKDEMAREIPASPLDQAACLKGSQVAVWKPYGVKTTLKAVEKKLTACGLEPSKADGIYDDATGRALITYQKEHNLPARGRLDDITFSSMGIDISKEPAEPSTPAGQTRVNRQGGGQSSAQREQPYNWKQWVPFMR
jgi:serine/threonine protein kinase